MNNKGKFNKENSPFLDITRFYSTKSGNNLRSVEVDAAAFDALQKVQIGSRLFVELVPAEKRKGEKSPHARLKLILDEAGAAASTSTAAKGTNGNGKRASAARAAEASSDI